jgi:hypothetical protein
MKIGYLDEGDIMDILEIAKRCSAGQAQPGDVELLANYIIYMEAQYKADLLNELDKASDFLDFAAKSDIPEKAAILGYEIIAQRFSPDMSSEEALQVAREIVAGWGWE